MKRTDKTNVYFSRLCALLSAFLNKETKRNEMVGNQSVWRDTAGRKHAEITVLTWPRWRKLLSPTALVNTNNTTHPFYCLNNTHTQYSSCLRVCKWIYRYMHVLFSQCPYWRILCLNFSPQSPFSYHLPDDTCTGI